MSLAYAECPLDVWESLAIQYVVDATKDEDTQHSTRLIGCQGIENSSGIYHEVWGCENCFQDFQTQAKDIEKEIGQAESYMENLISYKCKISQRIASLTPPVVPPVVYNSTNVPTSTTQAAIQEPKPAIKLPKLTVNKFYGDHKNWLEFRSQFENAIDKNSSLSKIEKLIYLKSLVGGVAAKAISGFALTENNYDAALELLKNRFGQKNLLINAHLRSLLDL
ncbi:hypothetical protein AVEN_66261-1, partial [Araneus ventricosus]